MQTWCATSKPSFPLPSLPLPSCLSRFLLPSTLSLPLSTPLFPLKFFSHFLFHLHLSLYFLLLFFYPIRSPFPIVFLFSSLLQDFLFSSLFIFLFLFVSISLIFLFPSHFLLLVFFFSPSLSFSLSFFHRFFLFASLLPFPCPFFFSSPRFPPALPEVCHGTYPLPSARLPGETAAPSPVRLGPGGGTGQCLAREKRPRRGGTAEVPVQRRGLGRGCRSVRAFPAGRCLRTSSCSGSCGVPPGTLPARPALPAAHPSSPLPLSWSRRTRDGH